MTYFPQQSGPCVICGDTNYGLSCGGPTICPKCDCGQFDAATVVKQGKAMRKLREALELARQWIDPDGDPVADSSREVLAVIDSALSLPRPHLSTPEKT